MRRASAGLGLAAILTGVPVALLSLLGPPRVPSFEGSEGLSGSYVPVDAVLEILAILAWSLWAYLAFAVVLSVLAELASRKRVPAGGALISASLLLTPKIVRRLVEVAVGGVFVAASVSGNLELRTPLPMAAAIVTVGDAAPAATAKAASVVAPKQATYRVRSGDSLWRIAERELGSGFRWREIYRLNKDRTLANGRRLISPHLIYPGWVLALPDQGRRGPVLNGDGGAPPAGSATAPEEEQSIAPSPAATEQVLPEDSEVREPTPEISEPEESEPHLPGQPAVRLPSGVVVAASFASGLLTAHLLGRLRQRRGRRVADSEPPELPEPALTADLRRAGASPMAGTLDVALHAVAKVWRQHRAAWPRILAAVEGERLVRVLISDDGGAIPPPAGGHMSPSVRFARSNGVVQADVEGPFTALLRRPLAPVERGVLVPIGWAPDGSVVHVGLASMGMVSVRGAEAEALARQLVLASAGQGSQEDVRIILLGRATGLRLAEALPSVSAYDWKEAAPTLREIQAELLRRVRIFFDEGVEDLWGHLDGHPDERLPGLVVVATEPPGALRGVVEALGQEGPSLGAGLLALGWRPAHLVMHAEVGSLSELDLLSALPCPRRLWPLVLDDDAAAQAADVLLRAFAKAQDAEPESEASQREAPVLMETPVPSDDFSSRSSSGAATGPDPPRSSDLAPVSPAELDSLPTSDVPEESSSEPPAPGEPQVPPLPWGLVAVRCLGPFEVWRDDRMLRKGWRNKAREILAYLIARPSGAPKERIIEELWPGIDPEEGSERFDRMTSELRSKVRGRDDTRRYVDKEDDVFYLESGAWWSDAWELERLVSEAERGENADDAVTKLREAVSLYRGEFCEDYYYPWAEGVRERFRAAAVRACGRLADLLSDQAQYDQAIAILDRGIAADPVCEDLSRRAMAIEASLGRRAAALARYRKLEARLDAELSVEPDPETQALAAQLQADSRAG